MAKRNGGQPKGGQPNSNWEQQNRGRPKGEYQKGDSLMGNSIMGDSITGNRLMTSGKHQRVSDQRTPKGGRNNGKHQNDKESVLLSLGQQC